MVTVSLASHRGNDAAGLRTPPEFLRHPDALDVDEFPDAVFGKLPPVTRSFDAAEGQARIGFDELVDEYTAGLDFGGDAAVSISWALMRKPPSPQAASAMSASAQRSDDIDKIIKSLRRRRGNRRPASWRRRSSRRHQRRE